MMRRNIRMQPSDREEPFNYLVIQSWRTHLLESPPNFPGEIEEKLLHIKLSFFFLSSKGSIKLYNCVAKTIRVGVSCPTICQSVKSLHSSQMNPSIPSAKSTFATCSYCSHTSTSVSQMTLTQTVARLNPLNGHLFILPQISMFLFIDDAYKKVKKMQLQLPMCILKPLCDKFTAQDGLDENVLAVLDGIYFSLI